MAFSRSPLDGDLSFFPVAQSAAVICPLWCVSLPCPHPSPTEVNKGPLTPSSRRLRHHHRHLFFAVVYPLLPLALGEGEHRELAMEQKGRGLDIQEFCSCLIVRLISLDFPWIDSTGGRPLNPSVVSLTIRLMFKRRGRVVPMLALAAAGCL